MVVKKIILLFLLGWEVAANLSGSSSGHAISAITYRGAAKELIFQVDRNAKAISPPPPPPLSRHYYKWYTMQKRSVYVGICTHN